MAGEFLSRQAALYTAPSATWERWTIDEIDEDVARVLIASAADREWIRSTSEQILAETTSAMAEGTSLADAVREQAMDAELEVASDIWTDEVAAFASLAPLGKFLNRRQGKPGLPTSRPLREGDVFWVVAPTLAQASMSELETVPLRRFAERIAELVEADADVWDVTAAARQAVKASYSRTVRESDEADAEPLHG